MPIARDIQSLADSLLAAALTGTPLSPDHVRTLATTLSAYALIVEAMEATAISQEVHDQMARVLADVEGERG